MGSSQAPPSAPSPIATTARKTSTWLPSVYQALRLTHTISLKAPSKRMGRVLAFSRGMVRKGHSLHWPEVTGVAGVTVQIFLPDFRGLALNHPHGRGPIPCFCTDLLLIVWTAMSPSSELLRSSELSWLLLRLEVIFNGSLGVTPPDRLKVRSTVGE